MKQIFSSQQMIEGDRHIRAAVARLTVAKNREDEQGIVSAHREVAYRAAMEKHATRKSYIEAILANDETRLMLNLVGRMLIEAELSEGLKDFAKYLKRSIGEDTTPGSTYIVERIGSDIYDLLSLYGAWATLGVRELRTKATKFPVTTALPAARFLFEGGSALPDDTSLTGSSMSPEAAVLAVMVHIGNGLWKDVDADIAGDLLEKFERSINALLDGAVFNGDGTKDATNGEMTGLFQDATITAYNAAAGNTTVETLDEADFLNAFGALPAGAIQRGPACWMNPTLILRAMKIKSGGQRIVKTALEAESGGALFSVCGFPLHAVAAAPSTNQAASKVAVVGEPGVMLVGIRKEFTLESSGHFRWDFNQRSFRGYMRARSILRAATGFTYIKTAAI